MRVVQPPVGNLRYAPPVANDKHYGQCDSTEHAYACPQVCTESLGWDRARS
jgi:carboxylesterase type B